MCIHMEVFKIKSRTIPKNQIAILTKNPLASFYNTSNKICGWCEKYAKN
jgi:hypothetical protein